MKNISGVTMAHKKDGTTYYRSSITIQSKHISLGSFDSAAKAGQAYREASQIIREGKYQLDDYSDCFALDFAKFVILINYRNSGIYFKTPIYLQTGFFHYYLSPDHFLIFDREDLFFYANHKLQTRGGYYFICDYGSQYNILSRYGIKNYARKGVDYIFVNQNEYDFRYENIKVINEYMGVSKINRDGQDWYECVIHIRGNYLIGRYPDKHVAAVAYNKAVDLLIAGGIDKKYIKNYIHAYSPVQYRQVYENIDIPDKIKNYTRK